MLFDLFNPATTGVHKKFIHTQTNLQLKVSGLFKYVMTFYWFPGAKELMFRNQYCTSTLVLLK